jgi:hypothetical protein
VKLLTEDCVLGRGDEGWEGHGELESVMNDVKSFEKMVAVEREPGEPKTVVKFRGSGGYSEVLGLKV